jgi:hypothetical protein
MYKVLIRSVLTYASETWTLSKTDEQRVGLFERGLLRCIFGANQEHGVWQKNIMMNYIIHLMNQILVITLK